MPSIEEVFDRHESRLMTTAGVEGVGIGGSPDAPVILVMVRQGATAMAARLPTSLEGYPVVVEVSGEISAQG